jgi:hypothetical protein
MKSGCPPIEKLEELLALEARDPRRAHLEDCPRCRARATAFRAFLALEPLPEGSRLEEARRRLSDAMREEAAARLPGWESASAEPPHRRRGWRSEMRWIARRSRSWWELWRSRPAWRTHWAPAFALVTLALAAIILVRVTGESQDPAPFHLRGPDPASGPWASPPASRILPGGAVELSWPALPAADSYRVIFSGADLAELRRIDVGPGARHVASAEEIRALGPGGAVVFWRVAALRGGDVVAWSPPATLVLPPLP